MNMLKEKRLEEWALDVQAWKDSGLTQKQWCEMKNVKLSTFKYRIHALNSRFSNAAESNTPCLETTPSTVVSKPVFAKVDFTPNHAKTADTGIKIKLKHTEITVCPDANSEHLRLVLEALSYA